jgi:DNA-binding CsgD family transcriptional regulator
MTLVFPIKIENLLALPLHIYWKDLQSKYLGCNDYMAENLCFNNRKDIIGASDADTIVPADSAAVYQAQDKRVVENPVIQNFFDCGVYKDDRLMTFLTMKLPIFTSRNKVAGVLGISSPIDKNCLQSGLSCFPTEFLQYMPKTISLTMDDRNTLFAKLSKREKQCLYYVVKGYSANAIATMFKLSKRTIEYYIDNVKTKLGCLTKTELIETAITNNFLMFHKNI